MGFGRSFALHELLELHLGDKDLTLLDVVNSWLPASISEPPAARIVVASLFIGWVSFVLLRQTNLDGSG